MSDKAKSILIGTLAGALLGAAVAWVASDIDDDDEEATNAVSSLHPSDYFQLGIGLLSLVRQFSGMIQNRR